MSRSWLRRYAAALTFTENVSASWNPGPSIPLEFVLRLTYNMGTMGFREARQRLVRSLLAGNYQHEIREVVEGKNLLDTGEVSPDEVVALLQRCRGDQYDCAPHHAEPAVPVHVFRPVREGEQWYVKAYLLGEDPDGTDAAVFISVHKSGYTYRGRRR